MVPSTHFMELAIREALKAKASQNYPIGAVVVKGDVVIAQSPNVTRTYNDPTMHAELEAIRKAVKALGTKFLSDCVLYSTHEPCTMCTTAAVWVKLEAIVYGCSQEDMRTLGQQKGDGQFPWRTVNISAAEVIDKSGQGIQLFPEFMRDECLGLFLE